MTNKPRPVKRANRENRGQHMAATAKQGDNEISVYAGILPAKADMEAWRAAVPDAPERILRLTEQEAQHRREMELRELSMEETNQPKLFAEAQRGQSFAALLNGLGLLCATLMAAAGAEIAASIVGGFCTVLLAGTYVRRHD